MEIIDVNIGKNYKKKVNDVELEKWGLKNNEKK
jgi:hypothetical protein